MRSRGAPVQGAPRARQTRCRHATPTGWPRALPPGRLAFPSPSTPSPMMDSIIGRWTLDSRRQTGAPARNLRTGPSGYHCAQFGSFRPEVDRGRGPSVESPGPPLPRTPVRLLPTHPLVLSPVPWRIPTRQAVILANSPPAQLTTVSPGPRSSPQEAPPTAAGGPPPRPLQGRRALPSGSAIGEPLCHSGPWDADPQIGPSPPPVPFHATKGVSPGGPAGWTLRGGSGREGSLPPRW